MTADELFAEFPQLETERLVLHEFKQIHAEDVFKLLSDERVTRYESRDPFTRLEQARGYVRWREFITRKKSEGIIWVISPRDRGEVIGDIGYNPHHGFNAEIGFKLRPDHWNKGLMSEAIRAVVRFLFNRTETKRIEALTRPENLAAARALEKNGFQKEGVMRECEHHKGASHDMAMYALLKRVRRLAPFRSSCHEPWLTTKSENFQALAGRQSGGVGRGLSSTLSIGLFAK